MDLANLFWCLINIEGTIRNSRGVDVIKDTLENN
jgi:hypothetical protein